MKKIIRLTESDLARIVRQVIKETTDNLKISIKPDSKNGEYNNIWISNGKDTYVWEVWMNHDKDMRKNYRVNVKSFDKSTHLLKFSWQESFMKGNEEIKINQNNFNKILSNYDEQLQEN